MNYIIVKIEDAEAVYALKTKIYKTGSKGFFGVGKLLLPSGQRYQININAVLIGSKPKEVLKNEHEKKTSKKTKKDIKN